MKNRISALNTFVIGTLLVWWFFIAIPITSSRFAASPSGQAVKFAVIGDSGTGDEHQRNVAIQMVARHQLDRYEFVLMVGDNIYNSGNPADYPKKFERPYELLLTRGVKFYSALGNHDVRNDNWKHAIAYPGFNMGGRRYYTFTKGDGLAQFFALDSTTLGDSQQDRDQLRWLTGVLKSSKARWKIAFFHHPLYSSGKTHGSSKKMRAMLEPILSEGNIQVVFSGHDHVYERIVPRRGIQYFVTGAAGQLRRGDLDRTSNLTAKGNDQVRHFMYVEIHSSELRFRTIGEQGQLLDEGTIRSSTP